MHDDINNMILKLIKTKGFLTRQQLNRYLVENPQIDSTQLHKIHDKLIAAFRFNKKVKKRSLLQTILETVKNNNLKTYKEIAQFLGIKVQTVTSLSNKNKKVRFYLLKNRQETIQETMIKQFFALANEEKVKTFKEIGDRLGLTRERIRQIAKEYGIHKELKSIFNANKGLVTDIPQKIMGYIIIHKGNKNIYQHGRISLRVKQARALFPGCEIDYKICSNTKLECYRARLKDPIGVLFKENHKKFPGIINTCHGYLALYNSKTRLGYYKTFELAFEAMKLYVLDDKKPFLKRKGRPKGTKIPGFSIKFKEARQAMGYSLNDLEDLSAIDLSSLIGYEKGICTPSKQRVKKLGKILDVDFEKLNKLYINR